MAAERVTITRTREGTTVTIDGVEIPANAIPLKDGIHLPVDGDVPRVYLALVAKRVDVVNSDEPNETESETP